MSKVIDTSDIMLREKPSIKKEVIITSIKILDIAYVSVIYATIIITFSVLFDYMIGAVDEKKEVEKNIALVILECWLHICLIAITAYIVRNIVERIPFPLDGVQGFIHSKVKELGGGPIYGFLLFFYSRNLRRKIELLIDRITGVPPPTAKVA
jgi:hypothetical protein